MFGMLFVVLNSDLSKKIISFYITIFIMFLFNTFSTIYPETPVFKYFNSINLFNAETSERSYNKVHINNVIGYYNMIYERPEILLFGRRGVQDTDYKNINRWEEYRLGTAHNAIFAKIFKEGIFSLILYLWFYISFFIFCLKRINKYMLPSSKRATIIGANGFMIGHFILTLSFIPPETTFKGIFFILFFMIITINFCSQKGKNAI
tara:strand:- start:525 stop:1142 length:618 start_codon:yes stop_codon:yes gene_type:complete